MRGNVETDFLTMHEGYIKVIYQGCTYGPIEAPMTLLAICNMIRVSLRAKPVLRAISRKDTLLSLPEEMVSTGLYELISNPNISYDESVDGVLEQPAKKTKLATNSHDMFTQTQARTDLTESNTTSSMLPLRKDEMKECVDRMLHLLATIPPRYIKYNKVLSQQIDEALLQADEWNKKLNSLYDRLESASTNAKHLSGVSLGTFMTFVQYRILNMLHDIWKTVWQRFAPASRVYSVSKIYTLHSLQTVEHILNCLSSWRRMIEREDWSKIKQFVSESIHFLPRSKSKAQLIMPPRLVSQEHAGDFIQLSQSRPELKPVRDKRRDLDQFRSAFVKQLSLAEVYRNEDMVRILNSLLREQEDSVCRSTESAAYPTQYIRQSICHEFQIYCL
jgi:hypothetical protein